MYIEITEKAYTMLLKQSSTLKRNNLALMYDYDGCGCVVSGVIHLVEIIEPTERFVQGTTNIDTIPIWYEKQYEWVYDERMVVDFVDASNSYRLKSDNQIFNSRMKFITKI
ncbi:iron-sulfur cluster biosynthesis family protein [Evansella sp. AB-rgal1]|uniref:iron-sulfur cluster biosynthesis family protein n=1 Tax=Evansella sp. AB-rgal1 TaxID=3242696 RepID=UPI00359DF7CF